MQRTKLKRLVAKVPTGVVLPVAWLRQQGYSPQLLAKYANSGWLERVGRGAYLRPGASLAWQGVVLGLQRYCELEMHVGGLTALEIQGHSHFVRTGSEMVIDVYARDRFPRWATSIETNAELRVVHRRLFNGLANQQLLVRDIPGVMEPIWVSSLERAYLELLDEVPNRFTFDHADYIMQGLPTLSPMRLRKLLQRCLSVKAKRLFFFFADRHDHAWRARLRPSDFDLGSGNRQLVKGGCFDKTYLITVPESYVDC